MTKAFHWPKHDPIAAVRPDAFPLRRYKALQEEVRKAQRVSEGGGAGEKGEKGDTGPAGATGPAGGGGTGHVIMDAGVAETQRANLDFQDGFNVADNAGADSTDIDLVFETVAFIKDVAAVQAAGTRGTAPRGDHVHKLGILTTKGDLIGYSTLPVRRAIGANGQVLTADSVEADGMKWATPASGVTDHALLTNVTADQHHARLHSISGGSDHSGVITDAQHGIRTVASAHRDQDIDCTGMKQTLVLSAAGGSPTTTAPCAPAAKIEAATNDRDYWVLDFDPATQEHAFWEIVMPDNWDGGTFTVRFFWTTQSGSVGTHAVIWGIQAISSGDDDAIDVAWGTAVEVTDVLLAWNDEHISAESAAITPSGTPAGGEEVSFRVYRKAADAGDTLPGDVRLKKVKLEYGVVSLSA